MDTSERIKMVKAMEFIARHISNKDIFLGWRAEGVLNDVIEYGDLFVRDEDKEKLNEYIQDEVFWCLMLIFLEVMWKARKGCHIYCDGIGVAK